MSIKLVSMLAAITAVFATTSAQAATVTVTEVDTNPLRSIHGLHENTAANGVSIAGSVVTANYGDGSSEELVWAQTSRWAGGVAGAFIEMSLGGSEFMLSTTKRLTSLLFDAGSGGALFDTRKDGTEGSKWGFSYQEGSTGILAGLIDVTYYGMVNVMGDPNDPSVYTHMLVDYSGTEGDGLFGSTSFSTDLDDLAFDGDLSTVPLPGGLPLLMAGIAGLGFVRRRKA